jgi:hypothetical protein
VNDLLPPDDGTASTRSTGRPDVLLVGAFERDNFGDSLFLLLVERLLAPRSTAVASVLSSDATSTTGRVVPSLTAMLELRPWDVVWVVGGEVGGVSVDDALPMSLPEPLGSSYESMPLEDRRSFDRFLTGLDADAPAYLPVVPASPETPPTKVVLHSVGLTGMVDHVTGEPGRRFAEAVQSAAVVSVREEASFELCRSLDVDALLGPDLVHTLPLVAPDLGRRADDTRRVVFQMNRAMLEAQDVDELADALIAVCHELGAVPVLFPAGTARHHDSAESYRELQEVLVARAPELTSTVLETRDPMALAAAVASSALWIGSSLHGRIVSAAYGVPRISLPVEKVSAYATTWDPDMPYDVPVTDLVPAARAAVERADLPEAVAASSELTRRARDTFDAVCERIFR